MGGCIFCDIVAGRAPASQVYRDEVAMAFLDIQPVNPGHVLIVPVDHATYLGELDEPTGMHLFKIAMRIAAAVRRSGVRCEGVNLFLADGEAAFQDVFHTHLHVIPRFKGDEFKIEADWSQKPARDELDRLAADIASVL